MQVVYAFLWAKVLIFQGSAHQNGVGSLSILVVSYRQTIEKLCSAHQNGVGSLS